MKNFRRLLTVLSLCCCKLASAQSASPTFGNVTVIQNDSGNAATSVSVSLSYSQAALSANGATSLGNIRVRSSSNRGDFNMQFTNTAANDRSLGIMISNVAQLARDNSAAGDAPGAFFATSATETSGGSYVIPVHATPGNGEFNANLAVSWFPYADGWIGGHAVNSVNNGPLTTIVGSPGLTISATAIGSNVLYDNPATNGIYDLSLADIDSQTDGILIVSGGKNEANHAVSRANADGTWTISVRDNASDGATEQDSLAFVYVPTASVVSGDAPGVHALGRLNGNLSRDITAGNYAMVRSGTGTYRLYAPGITPAQATLLLNAESAGVGADNLWFYEPGSKGWNLEYRDLPALSLQDNNSGEDTLSFALMASRSTAAIWDAGGGANNNWTTAANWVGDAVPTTGQDVVIGAGSGNVAINSSEPVGMLMISRDAGFTLSSNTPLRLNTGLIANAPVSSANQSFIISAPIQLEEDAFILSQTLDTNFTVRLDVASGNAITSIDKNLTLGGASFFDIRDPISLGNGILTKEGSGQVTLLSTLSVGGVRIFSGPNNNTYGSFRINSAAAYAAFGSNDIVLTHQGGTITPLFFDSSAGSGTFTNNIVLQSTASGSGARILLDNSAGFSVTLSGLISGGNTSSEFIADSDAATGQSRLHLTNTGNTFTAQRINVNRGALVVHGDGVLGHANNPLYLNTNVTDGSTATGLHFGADAITLAATRAITLNTTSPIHTGTHTATIAGIISGPGGLLKGGTGTLELTGTNTYLGTTTVKEGTLLLNPTTGTAAGAGALSIENLATLAGQGKVTGLTTLLTGGRIAPGKGTQPGTLSFLSGLEVQADASLHFDLTGNGLNDRLDISTGTLQLSPAALLQVTLAYTPTAGDTFDLLDWATLTSPTSLQSQLTLPSLTEFGLEWNLTQFDTQGILTIQLVPEPSRVLFLLLGLTALHLRRRR